MCGEETAIPTPRLVAEVEGLIIDAMMGTCIVTEMARANLPCAKMFEDGLNGGMVLV
jgi:hypothetical protein